MQIFKFGGAAINSYERIINLAWILQHHKDEKILLVISAMGKMTNTLEKVAEEYYAGKQDEALLLFESVKSHHLNFLKYMVTFNWESATKKLETIFEKTENILRSKPTEEYNYYYDQIVSSGELLSSTLISYFLEENHLPNTFADARNILRTDGTFRDGKLNWEQTQSNIQKNIVPLFDQANFVLTQGFIASDVSNNVVTLGREGSDYTAAIFANLLKAESVTIWKDVNGVMTGDPHQIKDATTLENLSYKEVIEMAFYGAKVIHPKTIKPLQNKNIPLYVKSFLNPELPGTTITGSTSGNLPPIVVYKYNQVLLELESIDFSFVEGEPVQLLHELLNGLQVKVNLTQNTAISLFICVDDCGEKIAELANRCANTFRVHLRKDLVLLTIRHHQPEIVRELTARKKIILEQKTLQTIQVLMDQSNK